MDALIALHYHVLIPDSAQVADQKRSPAQRPSIRFVAVKTEQQQASAMIFRTQDLLVRQRTQLVNALRGHLTKYGWVAPQGRGYVAMRADLLEDEMGQSPPEAALGMFKVMLTTLGHLDQQIDALDHEIKKRAREDEVARRLMTIPGIGPIAATAIAALAPPPEHFKRARDFAAWLGQRDIRRLLITGAMAVVQHASRKRVPDGSWLGRMLARKPRMLVAIALANKMARGLRAMITTNEDFRNPTTAAA